jgi:hypothetical protein
MGVIAVPAVPGVCFSTHRVYTREREGDGKPVARMVLYEAVPNR